MHNFLYMLTEKIQEFCSSTKKEATNTESISTPCGVNRRYSKQDLTALRIIEIQSSSFKWKVFSAWKVDINTAKLIGLRAGKKIIQIVVMPFKENQKNGLRIQLLILYTFHKATDSQTLDKSFNCGLRVKMHQSLFLVLIDTPDLRST